MRSIADALVSEAHNRGLNVSQGHIVNLRRAALSDIDTGELIRRIKQRSEKKSELLGLP
jgi:hypothetical protein